jgi:hypothetical protein
MCDLVIIIGGERLVRSVPDPYMIYEKGNNQIQQNDTNFQAVWQTGLLRAHSPERDAKGVNNMWRKVEFLFLLTGNRELSPRTVHVLVLLVSLLPLGWSAAKRHRHRIVAILPVKHMH